MTINADVKLLNMILMQIKIKRYESDKLLLILNAFLCGQKYFFPEKMTDQI